LQGRLYPIKPFVCGSQEPLVYLNNVLNEGSWNFVFVRLKGAAIITDEPTICSQPNQSIRINCRSFDQRILHPVQLIITEYLVVLSCNRGVTTTKKAKK
jgi:hypothetical protein